jgi:hypothetical protein
MPINLSPHHKRSLESLARGVAVLGMAVLTLLLAIKFWSAGNWLPVFNPYATVHQVGNVRYPASVSDAQSLIDWGNLAADLVRGGTPLVLGVMTLRLRRRQLENEIHNCDRERKL